MAIKKSYSNCFKDNVIVRICMEQKHDLLYEMRVDFKIFKKEEFKPIVKQLKKLLKRIQRSAWNGVILTCPIPTGWTSEDYKTLALARALSQMEFKPAGYPDMFIWVKNDE